VSRWLRSLGFLRIPKVSRPQGLKAQRVITRHIVRSLKAMTCSKSYTVTPFPKSGEKKGGPRMSQFDWLLNVDLPFSDGVYEVRL
jgi:hypothetical protein